MTNTMDNEKQFVDGMFAGKPSENAPEFIKAKISIKAAELIPFLEKHVNNAGYLNLDLKESKAGKLYLELNTYKPVKRDEGEGGAGEIPF